MATRKTTAKTTTAKTNIKKNAEEQVLENEAIGTEPVEEVMEAEPVEEIKDESEVSDGDVIGGTAEEIVTAKNEGDTVCVCSNYPFDIKYRVPDASGRYRDIVFKGNASNLRGKEKGILPIGAYGVTTNVPREAWDWILKHRPDEPAIKNGNLFATSASKARAAAEERKDVRHGYEPIEPKKNR